MNKAFVRDPEQTADYCPRCGSKGEIVFRETIAAHAVADARRRLSEPANFCPKPACEVAYFDSFERIIAVGELRRAVYPKDPEAPICACFGLTREDIERDLEEGTPTRVRALLVKANSPAAQCRELAANGQSCAAYVQKYYMQRLGERQAAP